MRTNLFKIAQAATLSVAMAFTFSCSSDNGGGGSGFTGTSGTFTDSRSNKSYKWVKIGEQYWMAENLNFKSLDGNSRCYPTNGSTNLDDNENANCNTYGRLYNWETAMVVCPNGWHLPSQEEWDALTAYIESDKVCNSCDSRHLKTRNWHGGLDSYGFSALPGGVGLNDNFDYVGIRGLWWSTKNNGEIVSGRGMSNDDDSNWHDLDKSCLGSVRCVQD